MGITFDVESIITHPSRRRPGPREYYIIQQEQLKYICQVFAWNEPPWNEPSETRGVGSSANYSRWQPLLDLALYLEFYMAEVSLLSSNDLIELAIHVEEQQNYNHPLPPIKSAHFTHLLNQHKNTAYWLPHDFERPQFIATTILEDPGQYDFSIGASLRVKQEMEQLCQTCDMIVAVRDPQTEVGIHTWASVQDLCHRIHEAAQESLTLNLPLQILW
jgi:hypothetical protein